MNPRVAVETKPNAPGCIMYFAELLTVPGTPFLLSLQELIAHRLWVRMRQKDTEEDFASHTGKIWTIKYGET